MASIAKKIRLVACSLLVWPALTGAMGYRSNFDMRILAAHNKERAGLGLPALKWNPDLVTGARTWSSTLARTGQFAHSPDNPGEELLGENIWGGDPGAFTPESMVNLWVSEKRQFRTGTFPTNSRTGNVRDVAHYTQMVWRSTGEVGCALSQGASEEILVCRYRNPGNVIGQKVF
jgi:hypothetical protein